jgi:hypothetical protein
MRTFSGMNLNLVRLVHSPRGYIVDACAEGVMAVCEAFL